MAIIYTYPKLTNPQGNELIVVSDVNNKNSTRLITIQSIADLVPGGGGGGCVDAITGIQTPVGTYNNTLCSTASFTSVNDTISISNTAGGVNFEAKCITNYVLKPSVCTQGGDCAPSQSPAGWLFSCESSLSQYAGTSTPVILSNNGVGIPNDADSESECYFIEIWSPAVTLAGDCALCCGDEPIVERCLYEKCSSSDEPNMPENVVLDPLNDSCVQVAYVTNPQTGYSCCYTFQSTTTEAATEYLTYVSAASCTQSPCEEPVQDTKWVYEVCGGECGGEPIVSENPIHSNGSGAFWYNCCFYVVPEQPKKTSLETNAPLAADIINGVEQDCETFKTNDQIKWLKCGTEEDYIYTSCCDVGIELKLGYTATGFSGPEGCFTIVDVAQGQDTVPCSDIEPIECSDNACAGEPTGDKWQYKECGQENFIDTSSNLIAYAPNVGEVYIWGKQGTCYEIRQNPESSGTGPILEIDKDYRDFTNEETNDPCDCCKNKFSNYRYQKCSISDPLSGCSQLPEFVVVDTLGVAPAQTILLSFQSKFTCCYVLVGATCDDASTEVTFTNLSGDCSSSECSGETPDLNKLYVKCSSDENTEGDSEADPEGDVIVVRSTDVQGKNIEQPIDDTGDTEGDTEGDQVGNAGCEGMPPSVVLPSNTVDGTYLVSDSGGNSCCYTYDSETLNNVGAYTIAPVDSCSDSACGGGVVTFKWQFRNCGQTTWNDAGNDISDYAPNVGEDYVFELEGNCTQVQKVLGVIDSSDPFLTISEADPNFSSTATPCDCCIYQRNVQYEACDPTSCQIPNPIVINNPNWPGAPPAVTLIENIGDPSITCCFTNPVVSCEDVEAGYGIPEGAPVITDCNDEACGGAVIVQKYLYTKCGTASSSDCNDSDSNVTLEIPPSDAVSFAVISNGITSCCYFKSIDEPGVVSVSHQITGTWSGNCEEGLPTDCIGGVDPVERYSYERCLSASSGPCETLNTPIVIEAPASQLLPYLKIGTSPSNYCCYQKDISSTRPLTAGYSIQGTFNSCNEGDLGDAGCLSGDVGGKGGDTSGGDAEG